MAELDGEDMNIVDKIEQYGLQGWIEEIPVNGGWLPFEEARKFVRSLGLKSQKEWVAWAKTGQKPDDIPSSPSSVYKDRGWVSWGDWLGTGRLAIHRRVWRPFEKARAFATSLGFQGRREWCVWAKTDAKPDDIPACPDDVYRDKGWVSFGDWLGTA